MWAKLDMRILQRLALKFIKDRPVEKMHVKELKEILFRKKVSLKGLTVKGQLVAK